MTCGETIVNTSFIVSLLELLELFDHQLSCDNIFHFKVYVIVFNRSFAPTETSPLTIHERVLVYFVKGEEKVLPST